MSLKKGQGGGVGEDNLTPTGKGGGGFAPGFKSRGWLKDVFGFDIFNSGIFFRLRKFGNSFFGWLDFMVVSTYRGCKTQTFNF